MKDVIENVVAFAIGFLVALAACAKEVDRLANKRAVEHGVAFYKADPKTGDVTLEWKECK